MTDIGTDPQGAHAAMRGLPHLSNRFCTRVETRCAGRPAQHGQPERPR
ncbi:hypothetical protein BJQ90_03616 [Arthrobacter sp. SO3]|nr:hypothetical protein [Arthrobacter sp. SO3]